MHGSSRKQNNRSKRHSLECGGFCAGLLFHGISLLELFSTSPMPGACVMCYMRAASMERMPAVHETAAFPTRALKSVMRRRGGNICKSSNSPHVGYTWGSGSPQEILLDHTAQAQGRNAKRLGTKLAECKPFSPFSPLAPLPSQTASGSRVLSSVRIMGHGRDTICAALLATRPCPRPRGVGGVVGAAHVPENGVWAFQAP